MERLYSGEGMRNGFIAPPFPECPFARGDKRGIRTPGDVFALGIAIIIAGGIDRFLKEISKH